MSFHFTGPADASVLGPIGIGDEDDHNHRRWESFKSLSMTVSLASLTGEWYFLPQDIDAERVELLVADATIPPGHGPNGHIEVCTCNGATVGEVCTCQCAMDGKVCTCHGNLDGYCLWWGSQDSIPGEIEPSNEVRRCFEVNGNPIEVPNDQVLVPFLTAFMRRILCMPALEEARLRFKSVIHCRPEWKIVYSGRLTTIFDDTPPPPLPPKPARLDLDLQGWVPPSSLQHLFRRLVDEKATMIHVPHTMPAPITPRQSRKYETFRQMCNACSLTAATRQQTWSWRVLSFTFLSLLSWLGGRIELRCSSSIFMA
jgi:hypothetical protein